MKDLCCENERVHESALIEISKKIPSDTQIYNLAELYKVFGDSTRTKILCCLEITELCVCDISKCLNMTKSAVSHQLRILRQAHLVKAKKRGKEVFYSLDDNHVSLIINCGLSHILEKEEE